MIADIVVIAIIGLSVYMGYKRGFVKTISKLCCVVVSIIVAKFLSPYVSGYVKDSFIGNFIYEKVKLSAGATFGENMPLFMQKAEEYTANTISEAVVSVITVLAIIIVTYLVANFIVGALNAVSRLPVISFANKLCGVAAGAVTGIILVYVLMAIVSVADFNGADKWFEGSFIAYKMYMDNVLMNLF